MAKFFLIAAQYLVSKRPQTKERDAVLDYLDAAIETIERMK